MPAPNDLITLTFSGNGAGHSIAFKPSTFRAAYVAMNGNKNAVALFTTDLLGQYVAGQPQVWIPNSADANWSVAQCQQAVSQIYTTVNDYYTSINS